jgi:CheW-like protein
MDENRRFGTDRRFHSESSVNIVVVSAGVLKYGLVVDRLHDSEEIVVKPLGRHLMHCRGYAGATIMGDGRVALILDVMGLSHMAALTSVEGSDRAAEVVQVKPIADREELIVIVFLVADGEVGLLATGPVDALEVSVVFDETTLKQPGIMGSTIINGQTTLLVDIYDVIKRIYPQWFMEREAAAGGSYR